MRCNQLIVLFTISRLFRHGCHHHRCWRAVVGVCCTMDIVNVVYPYVVHCRPNRSFASRRRPASRLSVYSMLGQLVTSLLLSSTSSSADDYICLQWLRHGMTTLTVLSWSPAHRQVTASSRRLVRDRNQQLCQQVPTMADCASSMHRFSMLEWSRCQPTNPVWKHLLSLFMLPVVIYWQLCCTDPALLMSLTPSLKTCLMSLIDQQLTPVHSYCWAILTFTLTMLTTFTRLSGRRCCTVTDLFNMWRRRRTVRGISLMWSSHGLTVQSPMCRCCPRHCRTIRSSQFM